MFARITHYKMKPESVESATATLNQMKDKIMSLPGMVQFVNTMNSDGSGCVISVVESQAISDANQEAVGQIWAVFADHLEGTPEATGFDVTANWSN